MVVDLSCSHNECRWLPDGLRWLWIGEQPERRRSLLGDLLEDFPKGKLAPWGLRAKSPDDFVRDVIGIDAQGDRASQII
jgi:hypothetical protein